MRADYDSEAGSVQISLGPTGELTKADDGVHPRAIVNLRDGRPVLIEILSASDGLDEPVDAVASAYDLDRDALLAAAQSALAVPDRSVVVEVAAPGTPVD